MCLNWLLLLRTDEFVAAGDFLSYKFPTWQWCAGSPSRARDYLPRNKQFLISCGVPSLRRVSQLEKRVGVGLKEDDEKLVSFDESGADAGEEDQWVATHFDQQRGPSSRGGDMLDIPDIGEESFVPEQQLTEGQQDDLAARIANVTLGSSSTLEPSTSANEIGEIADIPDIPDMDDETDDLAVGVEEQDDPATAAPLTLPQSTSTTSHAASADNGKLLSVRKYDCIITYDKYYQTPRMWLVGYDEHGVPLKPAQIFEDVSSDYAQKTVTIEPFPHGHAGPDSSASSTASSAATVGVATASIHPCKHASVMKKVIERMNASVIEEQKKAAVASGANGGEKKKKKGWSVSSAVKRVTGGGADASANANASASGSTVQGEAKDGAADGEGGDQDVEGLRVDQYMIIFLKFMASIVPAIEIDATQAV